MSRHTNLMFAALLRVYPRRWRDQYGDELIAVMQHSRKSPSDVIDVVANGLRERTRSLVPQGAAPRRARDGSLLVVWAWSLLAIAGIVVQKTSEHWQDATAHVPQTSHIAFIVLEGSALSGAGFVLGGIAIAGPSVLRFLRAGGWPSVRPAILGACSITLVAIAAFSTLVAWAQHVSAAQRSGGSSWYGGFFVLSSIAVATCLLTWARAAVTIARKAILTTQVLRIEALLAGATAAAMLLVSASSVTWWQATARAAPQFFTSWSTTVMAGATIVMVVAAVIATVGATAAVRSAQQLTTTPT
jgi:hypothetical protein